MKVQRFEFVTSTPVSPLGGQNRAEVAVPVAGSAEDVVTVSNRGAELRNFVQIGENLPDVRETEVAKLAEQIRNGHYRIEPRQVAESLLNGHLITGDR